MITKSVCFNNFYFWNLSRRAESERGTKSPLNWPMNRVAISSMSNSRGVTTDSDSVQCINGMKRIRAELFEIRLSWRKSAYWIEICSLWIWNSNEKGGRRKKYKRRIKNWNWNYSPKLNYAAWSEQKETHTAHTFLRMSSDNQMKKTKHTVNVDSLQWMGLAIANLKMGN